MKQETKDTPSVFFKLNLDEEIAYALFNESVPYKYKNNPEEFEKYLMTKNRVEKKEAKKTSENTQSKSTKNSFTTFLKSFFKTKEVSRYKPLITPLLTETLPVEHVTNWSRN